MIIDIDEWLKLYNWIASKLGIDTSRDELATDILSSIIGDKYVDPIILEDFIHDKNAIVFGAGPSLVSDVSTLEWIIKRIGRRNIVLITADGATKALIEHGLNPDIVVTDLDGYIDYVLEAGLKGSIIVIHGHGDNIDRINSLTPVFLNHNVKIHGTTQVKPRWNIFNYGGFTDGDRAVFLALNFKPRRVILAGMDLGYIIGEYSGKNFIDQPIKLVYKIEKLSIARKLLEYASILKHNTYIYSLENIMVNTIITIDYTTLGLILMDQL